MSLKSEKLAQRLQEIQKFVAERISQDATYAAVGEELVKIADSLKEGKLTVQIVSRYPIPAQALQKFLSTCEALVECYQFKIASLPSKSQLAESESPAALIQQSISANQTGQKPTYYKLSATQNTLIGRAAQCQILINDSLTLVSGLHAEVQPIPNADSNSASIKWQICDRSSNGTYINGKRLQGCQTLQTGDRITLAAPSVSQSSPEFIFECQSHSTSNNDECYRFLADCDVLCVVINASQLLSTQEKLLLEKASKTQLTKLVLVVDVPAPDSQTAQLSKTNLAAIEAWLKSQNLGNSCELALLLLRPFYPNAQRTTVDPSFQQELDKFGHSLETLVKQKPEDILLKRITAQVVHQMNRIECVFDAHEEALSKEIQRDEEKLQGLGREDLKEQAKKALKKASDDKDKFFKQVKLEINQSKAAFLDVFSKKSIYYKIHIFTDALKPFVIRQGGDKYVHIKVENTPFTSDANSGLTHLCYSNLSHWASKEWEQVYNFYAEGGLSGVFKRTYATLNFVSSLNIKKSSFQPALNIDIQRNFKVSSVEAPCESRYQPISPIGYIIKIIKNQTMQWMFLVNIILMLLTLVGISQQGSKNLVIQNIFGSIFSGLKNIPWLLASVLTTLLFFTFTFLGYAFQKENKSKIEQEAEKLKKTVCSHYQSFARSLVEKIVQDFSMELDEEEQRLKEAIETVGEQFTACIAEVEKSQLLIKSSLEKRKVQQKSLEKEKAELQKLKRF